MLKQRCLVIADDLTGGADTGAQFAKRGLSTLLISLRKPSVDFTRYLERDVLVMNTISRGLSPDKAFDAVSGSVKRYDKRDFPIIYKKIDSTLRGNIGYEIDAILQETKIPICFIAPSYPEQRRALVGGIMMVGERPLSLTEIAHDSISPVKESHVSKLLRNQSRQKIGRIDLTCVASGREELLKAVKGEQKKGKRILIFDAVSRQDLTNIAEVACSMDSMPLFVGSAGLAEEVAKKLSPESRETLSFQKKPAKKFRHIFIVSGSGSEVTHQQLERVGRRKIPVFQLNKSLLTSDVAKTQTAEKELAFRIATSLHRGHAILKTCSERLQAEEESEGLSIHMKIIRTLPSISLLALKGSELNTHDLALILIGGDTALGVLDLLKPEGVEIEGELLKGIVRGRVIGGDWDGLTTITKAGGFGKEDALEKIMTILETKGSPRR
jgi:uncharacterized protein YgbK (DUF1537 family)